MGELEGVGHGTPSSRKVQLEHQSGDAMTAKICEEQIFDTSDWLPRVAKGGREGESHGTPSLNQ